MIKVQSVCTSFMNHISGCAVLGEHISHEFMKLLIIFSPGTVKNNGLYSKSFMCMYTYITTNRTHNPVVEWMLNLVMFLQNTLNITDEIKNGLSDDKTSQKHISHTYIQNVCSKSKLYQVKFTTRLDTDKIFQHKYCIFFYTFWRWWQTASTMWELFPLVQNITICMYHNGDSTSNST